MCYFSLMCIYQHRSRQPGTLQMFWITAPTLSSLLKLIGDGFQNIGMYHSCFCLLWDIGMYHVCFCLLWDMCTFTFSLLSTQNSWIDSGVLKQSEKRTVFLLVILFPFSFPFTFLSIFQDLHSCSTKSQSVTYGIS